MHPILVRKEAQGWGLPFVATLWNNMMAKSGLKAHWAKAAPFA
jgi:hypothetical protein